LNSPQIGFGQVRHTRTRPRRNAFDYGSYFLMLPMRALRENDAPILARNRSALLSFHDRDHGLGGQDSLAWLESVLKAHGVHDADGEVWLHTHARVLGYTFKPVSFWYCHRSDGRLRGVLAEVNNTFGQRHCYWIDEPRYGVPAWADKVFHVSPFCPVQGRYRFVFMRTDAGRVVARIDYFDEDGASAIIHTSVSGQLEDLNAASRRRALWQYPAMTWGVIARIHWQAFRLWRLRTPFFKLAPLPEQFVSAAATEPISPPLNRP
jgi:uncharacterized protein